MAVHLFKTEPSTYAFADLVREKHARWNGVSNPVALKNMREIRKGDTIVIYHTGDEKSAVGLATVVSAPYPDPELGDPKRTVIDIEPVQELTKPVSLATVKADAVLQATPLAKLPRLSVMPLTDDQFHRLLELAGTRRG